MSKESTCWILQYSICFCSDRYSIPFSFILSPRCNTIVNFLQVLLLEVTIVLHVGEFMLVGGISQSVAHRISKPEVQGSTLRLEEFFVRYFSVSPTHTGV